MHTSVHVDENVHRVQLSLEAKRGIDFLELEFQAVVSQLMWVLGTKFGSSGREVYALRH